jgi:hypothetical protein
MFANLWLLGRLDALATAHAPRVADVHAGVVSLLVLAWCWPWLGWIVRRMRLKAPMEWVRQWRCPQCDTLNRQTYPTCSHCEYHLKLGFWRRRMPVLLSEKAAQSLHRMRGRYAAMGWILFYGITAALFCKLRLYRFPQTAPAELAGSGVMILSLVGLWYLRRAFRLRWKSPLALTMDAAAGALALYLAGFSLWLWSAAARDLALFGHLTQAYRWASKLSVSISTPPASQHEWVRR